MRDFLLDDNYDMVFDNGDIAIGTSDKTHQGVLLLSEKGSFKQFPDLGVGLTSFLKDDSPADLLRDIRLQFSADGMKVSRLGFVNGKLEVIAGYGN